MQFVNARKQLVLNTTNRKTLVKLLGTNDVRQWKGKRITLFVQPGIKCFGELKNGIRIRPELPAQTSQSNHSAEYETLKNDLTGRLREPRDIIEDIAHYTGTGQLSRDEAAELRQMATGAAS